MSVVIDTMWGQRWLLQQDQLREEDDWTVTPTVAGTADSGDAVADPPSPLTKRHRAD